MNTCAKCPELVESLDWVIFFCKAGNRPYIPDNDKLNIDCKSNGYVKCHYYAIQGKSALKAKYQDSAENADRVVIRSNVINPPAAKKIFMNWYR